MSNQYNYAGHTIIVDSVTELKRRTTRTASYRNLAKTLQIAKGTRALCVKMYPHEVEGVVISAYVYDRTTGSESETSTQCKVDTPIGVVAVDCKSTDHNPSVITRAWGTGFIALVPNDDDSVYYPWFLRMEPNNEYMGWKEYGSAEDAAEVSMDLIRRSWVIGTFSYDHEGYNRTVDVYEKAMSFWDAQVGNLMKVMSEAENASDEQLNTLAKAMGVEKVFGRIAVLEEFVNRLFANDIQIPITPETGQIRSTGYVDGQNTDGFIIKGNGDATFVNLKIKGNSQFEGEITSTALSTTTEKPGAGRVYTIDKDPNPLWIYHEFESVLNGTFSADGYYRIEGDYAEIRVGTKTIELAYIYPFYPSRVTEIYKAERDQTVTVTGYPGTYVYKNGENIGAVEDHNGRIEYVTTDVKKGDSIGAYYTSTGGDWPTIGYVGVRDNGSINRYSFFDSEGHYFQPEELNEGVISITYSGQQLDAPMVYRWAGMNTEQGGGIAQAGTATIISVDGSIILNEAEINSVYWGPSDRLQLTTSDLMVYMLSDNMLFRELHLEFETKPSINSVSSTTILPKYATDTIGQNMDGKRFLEGNFTTVNADRTWGAVFN